MEDIRAEKSRHEITLEVLKKSANATTPYLRFTGEVAINRTGIPVLDTRIAFGEFEGGQEWYPGGQAHGSGEGQGVIYSTPKA